MTSLNDGERTVKSTRERRKPERSLRWLRKPSEGSGVLRITVKRGRKVEETDYLVKLAPSDFGIAVSMEKLGQEDGKPYAVLVDDGEEGRSSCECLGWLHHGHCKHVDGCRALLVAGQWF